MKKKISKIAFLFCLPIVAFLTLGIFLVSGLTSGYVSALSGNGGGFFVASKSTLEINNGSTVSGNSAENSGGVYVANGGTLTLESENFNVNDIVSFGSYPMTIKENSVSIIASDVDSNGYYLGSDGERYAKLSAQTYDSSYVFSNGNKINNGTEYYFKVEPVEWRILSIANGQATLLSENIIDQHVFYHDRDDIRTSSQDQPIYPNFYYYSDIRTWLTSDFMNKLFTSEEQNILIPSTSSICYGDKVRLLSFEEAKNEDYGFKNTTGSDSARLKIATDFAIASNIALPSAEDRHGIWWLCDNGDLDWGNKAYMVYYTEGGITTFYVDLPRYGVVPTVTVELSALSKSSISSNIAESGGGVYNNGIFNMSGGSIKDNSSFMEGGGVFNQGTFTMNGGVITGNFGNLGGGGVCNYPDAEFVMNGGQIFGNSVSFIEYGDDILNFGKLTINAGTVGEIDEDSETFSIYNSKTMNINGGKICGNIYSSTTFSTNMSATIKGKITLGDDAKIIVEDYAGITPTYNIVVSNSRMNGTILTFKGSSTKPVLERLNISGYDSDAKQITVEQNSNGEWEVLLTSSKYEVSLNPIDGTWSDGTTGIKKQDVFFGEAYGELPTPTKTGYDFNGWFTSSTGGTQVSEETFVSTLSDHTLYAHWTVKTIKITLDKTGGASGTDYFYFKYGIAKYYSDSDCTNEISSLSSPTRTGYTFSHYYGDGTCGGNDGEAYYWSEFGGDLCTDIYADATLYASWTANEYTVSFDSIGGTCDTSSKDVTFDNSYGDLPTPTRVGYTFNGWSKNWFDFSYVISTDSNCTISGQTVTFQTSTNVSTTHVAVDKWKDWNYVSYGDGKGVTGRFYYSFTMDSTSSTSFDKLRIKLNGDKMDSAMFIDVSSLTDNHQYVLTFNVDTVELNHIVISNIMIEKNSINQATDFTSEMMDSSSTVSIPSNHTLFAHWTANNYSISFDANGGTCGTESKTVTYGKTYSDLPTPTSSDNNEFGGWFAEFDGVDDFINFGRDYMFEDKISIHLEAYSDNWADVRYQKLISCAQGGGWNIEGYTYYQSEYVVFTAYDKGVGYKCGVSSIKWSDLSAGWHTFDMVFDGTYLYGYLDGGEDPIVTSSAFTSGKIGYNATNSIMVGAEAGSSQTIPDGEYFNGKIGNVVIQHSSERYTSSNVTTWTIPAQDLTLKAKWNLLFFPTTWKTEIASSTYMTTTVNSSSVTEIQFQTFIPSGYNQIGTLSTGLKVYQDSTDSTAIAFINEKQIYAPESCYLIFGNLTALKNIYFYNFDTSKVTSMESMFYKCEKLQGIYTGGGGYLDNFNTSNVTDMSGMFYECHALTYNSLSVELDTSKVTTMACMFYNCSRIGGISGFKTSNVTNMISMFKLTSPSTLDLSTFDMSKVKYATNMLAFNSNCTISLLRTPYNNTMELPITVQSGHKLYNSNVEVTSVPAGTEVSMIYKSSVEEDSDPYDLSADTENVYFTSTWKSRIDTKFSINPSSVKSIIFDKDVPSGYEYLGQLNTGLKVYKSSSDNTKIAFAHGATIIYSDGKFFGMNSLEEIIFNNFDTSGATDMSSMFKGCSSLTEIDVSSFNTSKVTNVSKMFYGCSNVKTINMKERDLNQITKDENIYDMVLNCSALNYLYLPKFGENRYILISAQHVEDGCVWDKSLVAIEENGVWYYKLKGDQLEAIEYSLCRVKKTTSSFTSNTGLSNLQVDQLTDIGTIENVSVVSQIEEDQSTLDVLISDEKKKYFIRKIKNIADDD